MVSFFGKRQGRQSMQCGGHQAFVCDQRGLVYLNVGQPDDTAFVCSTTKLSHNATPRVHPHSECDGSLLSHERALPFDDQSFSPKDV